MRSGMTCTLICQNGDPAGGDDTYTCEDGSFTTHKAFMADKGWSFKGYKLGDCEATWNTKEKVTRDTKYKGVYYVKRGKKTSTVFASQNLGGCTTDAQCPSSYCQNHFE